MRFKRTLLAIIALSTSTAAFSHGYINSPASRSYNCSIKKNINCGPIQWEPQSLEAVSGFPRSGPADGQLASAGLKAFSPLDEQTSDRWVKQPIKAGKNSFRWNNTAKHVTRGWRYYITKADWNPNQPLTRASFEATPFCTADGGNVMPAQQVTHECEVPARKGYQIIYGVWEIGDTINSFYNVVDVMFEEGGVITEVEWPTQVGSIQPVRDLKVNDRVIARVFDQNGERTDLATEIVINTEKDGDKNAWSHALASKINAQHPDLRAGQKDAAGQINPAYGQNLIYVKKDSRLTRVEITIQEAENQVIEQFTVRGLAPEYQITGGKVTINFDVAVDGKLDLEATVFNHNQTAKGYTSAKVENATRSFSMTLNEVTAGHHMLVIKSRNSAGELIQQTLDFMLKAEVTNGGNNTGTAPAWERAKVYASPCNKVLSNGKVWMNGWWTQGTQPGSDGTWGVWREVGANTMHAACKNK